MAGWHHGLYGCESEWTPGVGVGQEAWRAVIHGVAKSQIRLIDWSDLIFFFSFSPYPHYPFLSFSFVSVYVCVCVYEWHIIHYFSKLIFLLGPSFFVEGTFIAIWFLGMFGLSYSTDCMLKMVSFLNINYTTLKLILKEINNSR